MYVIAAIALYINKNYHFIKLELLLCAKFDFDVMQSSVSSSLVRCSLAGALAAPLLHLGVMAGLIILLHYN